MPEKRIQSNLDAFSGCSIRISSDSKDWTRYVLNEYHLFLDCYLDADDDIDMWVEIKGLAIEMYKQRFRLTRQRQERIEIPLKEYLDDLTLYKDKAFDYEETAQVFDLMADLFEKAVETGVHVKAEKM